MQKIPLQNLKPGHIYKLINIIAPKPLVYISKGALTLCENKKFVSKTDVFMYLEAYLFREDEEKEKPAYLSFFHENRIGVKILIEDTTGWLYFFEDEIPYTIFFEEITEAESEET